MYSNELLVKSREEFGKNVKPFISLFSHSFLPHLPLWLSSFIIFLIRIDTFHAARHPFNFSESLLSFFSKTFYIFLEWFILFLTFSFLLANLDNLLFQNVNLLLKVSNLILIVQYLHLEMLILLHSRTHLNFGAWGNIILLLLFIHLIDHHLFHIFYLFLESLLQLYFLLSQVLNQMFVLFQFFLHLSNLSILGHFGLIHLI